MLGLAMLFSCVLLASMYVGNRNKSAVADAVERGKSKLAAKRSASRSASRKPTKSKAEFYDVPGDV